MGADRATRARWLRADYAVACDGEAHAPYRAYAGIMVAVYPVGIPLLYYALLRRQLRALDSYLHRRVRARPVVARVRA